MRVVLVHDFLTQFGGAERVLQALASLFPDAPIYTLVYDEEIVRKHFPGKEVRGSFLQSLPARVRARHRLLLPLYPYAVGRLDVRDFDIVISSSSAFAKGVKRGPHAMHICYCHAPARFLWEEQEHYLADNHYGKFVRSLIRYALTPLLRRWDIASARRVDVWVANSATTQRRIRTRYEKNAVVIYPPLTQLNDGEGRVERPREYFLIVSRLAAYKKIDVVIDAFTALGLPLVIVGEGPERKRLEGVARPNITFTGFVTDEKLAEHYRNAVALIVACEEDFGISAIEALSFGTTVLAYRKGGVAEWMEEGVTGEFFDTQTSAGVRDGVRRILHTSARYDRARLREIAHRFDESEFRAAMLRLVSSREGVDK
ncbi:glycosyltransferase [Candidatus Azambacteria bacterium]|nr:glycosyltransferase [Candidatus Azambacteria bacterium]